MSKSSLAFEVLSRFEEVKPYVDQVRNAADKNKESLGFLPGSVYGELARKECLYVLLARHEGEMNYAGHLLFSQAYPSAKVIQMYTQPTYRRSGAATFMLDHFKAELTAGGFTSIYSNVAQDLVEANAFWERQQFHIQTIKPGGEARKRFILQRCHELDSPQLFPRSGLSKHNPLGLQVVSTDIARLWLLDLNVIFDLTGPRRQRHPAAVGLFQAERLSLCKLAVSDEMRRELKGTASAGKIDPMEGIIDLLPEIPLQKFDPLDELLTELHSLVFPMKPDLSRNDKSDLCHVATAIQHSLVGLITNDETILAASREVKNKYGIELISPDAFIASRVEQQTSAFEGHQSTELVLRQSEKDQTGTIHAFLRAQDISAEKIAATWLPTGLNTSISRQFGVWANGALIGYIMWSNFATQTAITAHLAVEKTHANALDAARIMLVFLIEQLPKNASARIDLELPPLQSEARNVAVELGFKGVPGQQGLFKVAQGGVLTELTWETQRKRLELSCGVKLPNQIPRYQGPEQPIPVVGSDGYRRFLPLDELESLLIPALFCLPGRPAVITPIKRSFAEPLLGHSPQGSLLPSPMSSLYHDKHYMSAARNLRLFKRGALIFFYESGREANGRSSLVAMARVRQAYLKYVHDMNQEDYEHSVLNDATIAAVGRSKRKTVVVFDNIFVLPNQISLKSLQRLGCGAPRQLLSTSLISDAQVQGILQESFGHG